jgi:uncharacterized protein (TIGR00661 family)
MRTFFYGVSGNGLGHASRALALGRRLQELGFRPLFFSHGRAVRFLREHFPPEQVIPIPGLTFAYRENQVDWGRTCAQMPGLVLSSGKVRRQIRNLAAAEGPELILSDYEPVLARLSRELDLPLVAVDHQQFLTELQLDWSGTTRRHRIPARTSNRVTYGRNPVLRVISSFFPAPLRHPEHATPRKLLGPLLGADVLERSPSPGGHVVIYQTSATHQELDAVLDRIPGEKRIYGCPLPAAADRQVIDFDRCRFLDDLASCRYAVLNGGFSAMAEAFFFGKPVLSLPVGGQVEQEMNALYLERLNLGCRLANGQDPAPVVEEMEGRRTAFQEAIRANTLPPGTEEAAQAVCSVADGTV